MLRKAMEKAGIKEIRTYNGGRITATNGMTRESAKAQSRPTTQHVTAVYKDGHTEDVRKCTILKRAAAITHEEHKKKVKDNLHKMIDKL